MSQTFPVCAAVYGQQFSPQLPSKQPPRREPATNLPQTDPPADRKQRALPATGKLRIIATLSAWAGIYPEYAEEFSDAADEISWQLGRLSDAADRVPVHLPPKQTDPYRIAQELTTYLKLWASVYPQFKRILQPVIREIEERAGKRPTSDHDAVLFALEAGLNTIPQIERRTSLTRYKVKQVLNFMIAHDLVEGPVKQYHSTEVTECLPRLPELYFLKHTPPGARS